MFAATVTEAEAVARELAKDAEAKRQQEIDEQRHANPPLDSASQIQLISIIKHEEEQSRRRLADERAALLQQLTQSTEQIGEKQAELERLRETWDVETDSQQQRKIDEQFLQAVRQFEQLPPKQSKRMLVELINQNQMEQAVEYLAAMSTRTAGRVLKEFKTDEEITLATELLERLRTHGIETSPAADASEAPTVGWRSAPRPELRHDSAWTSDISCTAAEARFAWSSAREPARGRSAERIS